MLGLPHLALSQRRIHHGVEERLRTLGCFVLALQVQGTPTPESGLQGDIVSLVARSTPVSKAVLLILILFSIASWAIILHKLWSFWRVERQTARFLEIFRKSNKFSEVQAVCRSLGESPLVGIFQAGYAELNTQLRATTTGRTSTTNLNATSPGTNPGTIAGRPTLKSLAALDRALLRAAGGRSEQARAARVVSRHDREHHAVHRIVRHGLGNHGRVSGNRRHRLDQSRAWWRPASPRR